MDSVLGGNVAKDNGRTTFGKVEKKSESRGSLEFHAHVASGPAAGNSAVTLNCSSLELKWIGSKRTRISPDVS